MRRDSRISGFTAYVNDGSFSSQKGPGITDGVNTSIMKIEFEVFVHIQGKYSQRQRMSKEIIERGETKL